MVLAFGTYDSTVHPRVRVLIDGLRDNGVTVEECNVPLGLDTAARVEVLRKPWLLPRMALRILGRWVRLAARSLRRRGARPDAVLVGYMGHFDVLLARALYPRTTIALDHLISGAQTAVDRGQTGAVRDLVLRMLDGAAVRAADIVVVDTEEHRRLVPPARRKAAVVIPVGAPESWFVQAPAPTSGELSVIFFGLFTPLQGAPVIGQAIRLLHERDVPVRFTLVGSGQDADAVHDLVDGITSVTWHRWVDGADLPALVAAHDVSLGIFGTTAKANHVVPNKVFQGAAAGTAVVTSDTAPQRRILGDAAVLVPPGDPEALAQALTTLAHDRQQLETMRARALDLARAAFMPRSVVQPLLPLLGR